MCSIENCKSKVKARGWCAHHLRKFYRWGDPLHVRKLKKDMPQSCRIEDCKKKSQARGLCQMHYRRWSLYGNPLLTKADPDRETYTPYKYVTAHGHPNSNSYGKIPEHRLVMSEILGRALLPHENVHHKNGDRRDNRPENLELWNTSQPAGQRIEDKVDFALMILDLYAPEYIAMRRSA